MDYEELLKRARKNLPESVFERERFEIPKVIGHLEGNKTIISNFSSIISKLRRQPEHLLKFLLRELATPGEIRGTLLIFGTKIAASRMNQKILAYADRFVFCQECGKPDTDIKREGGIDYLGCSVCGARNPIKRL